MAQKVEIEISARLDQALSQMKAMQDQLNTLGKTTTKASNQVSSGLKSISASTASTSAALTTLKNGALNLLGVFGLYAGVGQVVSFFKEGANAAIEFESAIRSINAILPEGERITAGLEENLKGLAVQFGSSAQAQAKGYYEILQAGIKDTAKIQDLLAVSNKAAIAGLTDLGTTSRVLSSVLNAYAKTGLTATEASDKLFAAVVEGQTTFEELSGTIGRVTPIAAAAGISLGEVAGTVAYLTKSGIQTDEAVTGLRGAIADIIKPTKQATELARQLGIDFSVSALQTKGFAGVLDDVRRKTGGSQEAIALLFEDIRAQVAVTSILKGNWEDYVAVMDTVQKSTGQTSKAFNEQSESYQEQIKRLNAEWNNFSMTVAGTVVPAILKIIDSIRGGITWLDEFTKKGGLIGKIFGVPQFIKDKNAQNEKAVQLAKEEAEIIKTSSIGLDAMYGSYKNIQRSLIENKQAVKELTEEEIKANEKKAKEAAERLMASKEQLRSNVDSLISQLEKVGMSQTQLIEKEKKDRLKLINEAASKGAITTKQASEFRTQVEKDATDKINKYREKEEEELLKKNKKMFDDAYANPLITLFNSIFKNVQLDVNSALGVAGGIGSSLSQGAAGAGALISSTAAAGLNALAPGLGDAAKPFIEMLGASEEQMRNTIRGFADGAVTFIENLISNIPLLIEELINGASRIIDRLVQDAPRIITKLIEDTPKIITALASNMNFVAGELAAGLIAEAPNIAAAIIKAIPNAAGGAISGGGKSFGGFFKKIGFAEGGSAVVKSVPSGFPNDTYPAMLTSQELVVDRSTAFRLKEFLQNEEKGKTSKSQQQYMPMGDIVVSIDGREIARAVRSQVKQGFAL